MSAPRDISGNQLNNWAREAIQHFSLSGTAQALFLLLADMGSWQHEQGHWACWARTKYFSTRLGKDARTMRRAFAQLEDAKLVLRQEQHDDAHGGQRPNLVIFNVANAAYDGIRVGIFPNGHPDDSDTPSRSPMSPRADPDVREGRTQMSTLTRGYNVHAPVLNPSDNPSSSSSVRKASAVMPEPQISRSHGNEEEEKISVEQQVGPPEATNVASLRHRGVPLNRLKRKVHRLVAEHPNSELDAEALTEDHLRGLIDDICADPALGKPVNMPDRLVDSYLQRSAEKCLDWLRRRVRPATSTAPNSHALTPQPCTFKEHASRDLRGSPWCVDCKAGEVPKRVSRREYDILDSTRQHRVDEACARGDTEINPEPWEDAA